MRAAALALLLLAGAAGAEGDWTSRIVRQTGDVTCGAAAVATLIALSGPADAPTPTEGEVLAALMPLGGMEEIRRRGGFSLLDLARYLESRGLRAVGEDGLDPDALGPRLPAILPIRLPGGRAHFVVAVAWDGRTLDVADPATGPRRLDRAALARAWDGVAFRIVPR